MYTDTFAVPQARFVVISYFTALWRPPVLTKWAVGAAFFFFLVGIPGRFRPRCPTLPPIQGDPDHDAAPWARLRNASLAAGPPPRCRCAYTPPHTRRPKVIQQTLLLISCVFFSPFCQAFRLPGLESRLTVVRRDQWSGPKYGSSFACDIV